MDFIFMTFQFSDPPFFHTRVWRRSHRALNVISKYLWFRNKQPCAVILHADEGKAFARKACQYVTQLWPWLVGSDQFPRLPVQKLIHRKESRYISFLGSLVKSDNQKCSVRENIHWPVSFFRCHYMPFLQY